MILHKMTNKTMIDDNKFNSYHYIIILYLVL